MTERESGDGDTMQRPLAGAAPSPAVMPMPLSADGSADGSVTEVRAPLGLSPDTAPRPGRDTGSPPEWAVTRLDQGPGWTLEVVRPRTVGEAGVGEMQMQADQRG